MSAASGDDVFARCQAAGARSRPREFAIDTYGTRVVSGLSESTAADEAMLKELKALGYLGD